MASPLTATLTLFGIQVGFPVAGILIGDKLLKSQKDKKIRYGVGITAFAFGGWMLSSHFATKYLENVEITFGAEFPEPYFGTGGLDFGRDTKGRFRRKLVTPIQDIEYEYGNLTIEKGKDMEIFTAALNRGLKKRGILARCESSSYKGKKAIIKLKGLDGLDYPHGELEAIEFARKSAYDKIAYPLDSVVVDFHRTYEL